MRKVSDVSALLGETIVSIEGCEIGTDQHLKFVTASGRKFLMGHFQDCCEIVYLQDVCGDIADLIGSPVLQAEESSNSDSNPPGVTMGDRDSFTWTFYRFSTINGSVVLRWYGESNGYYSESVDFEEVISE